MISAIVARAHKNVIGQSNELPWYLPADLRHFKQLTSGHTVVMGRKTYDSIVARLGKPLPDRTNIVITRDQNYKAEGALVAHSIEEAITLAGQSEVFVIGGAQIYEQALPFVQRLYITEVNATIDGDTFFPELAADEWRETSSEHHTKDDHNEYDYDFVSLERVN